MDVQPVIIANKNNGMSKRREQGLATRMAILSAAESVVLEHGASATTLEMIAEQAHVTRGAIYWHFKNKNEILQQIADEAIVPLLNAFKTVLTETRVASLEHLAKAIVSSLRTILASPAYQRRLAIALLKCEYTQEYQYLIERQNHYHEEIQAVLTAYLAKVEQREGPLFHAPHMIASGISFYLIGMLLQFLKNPSRIDLDGQVAEYIDMFFNPLLKKEKTP